MRNIDPFDEWTLAHIALGFCLRKMGFSRRDVIAIAIVFELLEGPVTKPRESNANQIVDVAADVLGWELAGRF